MSKDEITGETIYNLEVRFINKDKSKFFKYQHRIKFYENDGCSADIIMPDIWFEHKDIDKYVANLEAKLAESEKKYAELFCRNIELETLYSQKTALLNFYKDTDLVEENKQLKQQLAEKDADIIALDTDNYSFKQQIENLRQQLKSQPEEIVEKIKDKIPEIGGMKCEIIINDFLTLNTLLDNILKEYQK